MKLYFVNSGGIRREIADVKDKREAFEIINEFLAERNYKSYYTNIYTVNNVTVFDVGSWSEQFELELGDDYE